jgi:hypothetical protein
MSLSRRQWIAAQLRAPIAPAVEIYSEFVRVDPFGAVVGADSGAKPREILSPAAPRGSNLSFHVAVTAPARASYFLYIVPNPLDGCGVRLFREHFVGGVPDRLEELRRLPEFGVMPDPDQKVPGQTTSVYLLDLAIPRETKLEGFRLEVQLKMGMWVVRPLEVRVLPFSVPEPLAPGAGAVAPVAAAARATADLAVSEARAGGRPRWDGQLATVRDVIRRNAVADLQLLGAGEAIPEVAEGPEGFLRFRSTVYAKR